LVCDAYSNPVTTSGPGPAALLYDAVTAYLGFRKDVGDRLKAVFVAARTEHERRGGGEFGETALRLYTSTTARVIKSSQQL
jgi:hypothetical protein